MSVYVSPWSYWVITGSGGNDSYNITRISKISMIIKIELYSPQITYISGVVEV